MRGCCTFAPDTKPESNSMKGRQLEEEDGEGHGPIKSQGAAEKRKLSRRIQEHILLYAGG
jgi:hypothetical protein